MLFISLKYISNFQIGFQKYAEEAGHFMSVSDQISYQGTCLHSCEWPLYWLSLIARHLGRLMQTYLKGTVWQNSNLGTFLLGASSSTLSFLLGSTEGLFVSFSRGLLNLSKLRPETFYTVMETLQNTALSNHLVLTVCRSERYWMIPVNTIYCLFAGISFVTPSVSAFHLIFWKFIIVNFAFTNDFPSVTSPFVPMQVKHL